MFFYRLLLLTFETFLCANALELKCSDKIESLCWVDLNAGDKWSDGEPITISGIDKFYHIYLNDCKWTTFPSIIFKTYPNLMIAYISCPFTKVDESDSDSLKNLKWLSTSKREIAKIPQNAFTSLKYVENMKLYDSFTYVEDFAFSGMFELKELSLFGNNLSLVSKNMFAGVPKLSKISLSSNKIDTIEEGAFDLPELENLNLGNNLLTILPNKLFANVPKLKKLFLFGNKFTTFPQAIYDLSEHLEELSFTGGTEFEINLTDLLKFKQLKTIDLQRSKIAHPDKEIEHNNSISDSKITFIDLYGAIISVDILEQLSIFPKLEDIKLVNNGLDNLNGIDTIMQKFPRLKTISLMSGNNFNCEWLEAKSILLMSHNITLHETWLSQCPKKKITVLIIES